MGITNSVPTGAKLKVVLDNRTVIPGSQVTGRVCLTVYSERIDADIVTVSLTGAEFFKLNTITSQGSDLAPHHYPFFEESVPVAAGENGTFSRGQYEYPFSFTIPVNGGIFSSMRGDEPSRFGFGSHNVGSCSITYVVEAKVQTSPNRHVRFFQVDLAHQEEVFVLRLPPLIPRSPSGVPPVEYPLKDRSNLSRIRFGFMVSNNVLAAGEVFNVGYVILSNCFNYSDGCAADEGKIEMEFQLIEEVRFGAENTAPAHTHRTLFTRRFRRHDVLVNRSLPVEPNDSVSGRAGSATITHPLVLQQMQTIMNSRRHLQITFQVPETARPTIDTKFIHVNHYLKMIVLTPKRRELMFSGLTVYSPGVPAVYPPPVPVPVPAPSPLTPLSTSVRQQLAPSPAPYQQQQQQDAPLQQSPFPLNPSSPFPLNNHQSSPTVVPAGVIYSPPQQQWTFSSRLSSSPYHSSSANWTQQQPSQNQQFQQQSMTGGGSEEIPTAEVSATGVDYIPVAEVVVDSYGGGGGGEEGDYNTRNNNHNNRYEYSVPIDIFIPTVVADDRAASYYSQQQQQERSHPSVENLISRLSDSLDPAREISQWCQQNNPDIFTADDLGQLFTFLWRSATSQIAFADQLVVRRSQISCAHIAAVLNRCSLIIKTDLAGKLSVRCFDKFQNKTLVRAQLSPFEWTCVESCYA
jgi:hypothetical protein